MSAYQLVAPAFAMTANSTPDTNSISRAYVTGNLAGAVTPLTLKVTNTSSSVPVFFDADTSTLSVATGGTVIGPGQTEFIQVLDSGVFTTVYVAASAASSVTVYVTPVTLVD